MAEVMVPMLQPKLPSESLRGGTMMPAIMKMDVPKTWTMAKTATITQL